MITELSCVPIGRHGLPATRHILVVDMPVLVVLGIRRRMTVITAGSPGVIVVVGIIPGTARADAARMAEEVARLWSREQRQNIWFPGHQHSRCNQQACGDEKYFLHVRSPCST